MPNISYPGPTPVNTTTGLISDPGNMQPSLNDCLPYQCGIDPSNSNARFWCAYWGRSGNLPCTNPECAPWIKQIPFPGCGETPAPPPFQAPVTNYPKVDPIAPPASKSLSPQTLLRPLPQIVPTPQKELPTQMCGGFTGWVGSNPLLAAAVLVGVYFVMKGGK